MRDDWKECKLGDLLKLKNGYAFKSSNYINEGTPVIRIGDINDWIVDETKAKCVSEKKEYDDYVVEKDDILIAMSGATTGKFGIYHSDNKAYQNQRVGNLKPHSKVLTDKKFIYFLLYSLKYQIEKDAYGGAQPNISSGKIEALKTMLAPLPEQRTIVAKIEELFSSLDSGIADLKKAQDQLKIYRKALLNKSFDSIKEYIPLNDCGLWKGGGTPSLQVKEYWENGNIPWVSSRDVKTKDIFDTERHITEIAIPNSSTKWIDKEAILFVVRSGILRRIFPIAIAKSNLCVNQDIQTLTLDERFYSEYIYWFLVGKESNIRHTCSKDGTTVESIDSAKLKSYKIPNCSLKEQHQIVQEIESRLSVCDKVEESIVESLEKSKALRQSILKKAFEGKLLNDAEIASCKSEADYEPANVLLERIKKAAVKKSKIEANG
jgi:type I restriction enzyme S subunit